MIPAPQKFSNCLSDAEAERLAILLEELGEAQQAIGKILRHGYESRNPHTADLTSNREHLEKELGDISCIVNLMKDASDLDQDNILSCAANKRVKIKPYLHHQEATR